MAALDLLWLYVNYCGPVEAVSILSAAVDLQWLSVNCCGPAVAVFQLPRVRCDRQSAAIGQV